MTERNLIKSPEFVFGISVKGVVGLFVVIVGRGRRGEELLGAKNGRFVC